VDAIGLPPQPASFGCPGAYRWSLEFSRGHLAHLTAREIGRTPKKKLFAGKTS
jgi:hypothetical protein